MILLLRGGRVIDPSRSFDREADLLVEDGRIARVEAGISPPAGARVVDVAGRVVAPGLVDPHVHLREPGQEHKEDIASGTRAAAAGGFTTVCCMANTKPVNDCAAVTATIVRRAREVGAARVHPIGAITRGLEGLQLADHAAMKAAGAVALSDDGRSAMDAQVMRRALASARDLGLPVVQHCEDEPLARGTVAHESPVTARAGLAGQPAAAETVVVARDLELVELTGARYHVAHVSAAATVRLVRDAKRRGLPVTAEVTPHHLTLTDEAVDGRDTSTRVNPPLRGAADREALWAGLADGTLDCIATDHAPHSPLEKDVAFERAAPGMIGLETALALGLRLVAAGVLPLSDLLRAMSTAPARILGLAAGTLAPGSPADVVVVDLERAWRVDPATLRSKSKNTPFAGWELRGKAVLTLCGGTVTHEEA